MRPPVIQSQVVIRHELLAQLMTGQSQLTLIVAGAGFGKTSLLSQWYAAEKKENHNVAWVSLDSNDSDPLHLMTSMVTALIDLGFKLDHLAAELKYGPHSSNVIRGLSVICHALEEASDNALLILDDYHIIQSQEVDDIIDLLLARLPSGFRIAIATRTRPSIALPTLLARGNLLLIDDSRLRFSFRESQELFGELLDRDSHEEIFMHTNGWAFALQMARILARENRHGNKVNEAFSGSSDEIAHYLTDQVLLSLPKEVQEFLIDTSLLRSVCAALADAVREKNDSAALLNQLQPVQASFVLHEAGNLWYRYHPLFAEFLQGLLVRKGEKYTDTIHRNAAIWYAGNDMLSDAIDHAVTIEDIELTVNLFDTGGGTTILQTHGISTFNSIMNAIPSKWIHQAPMLTLGKAALLAREGKTEESRQYINEVKRSFGEDSDSTLMRDILFVDTFRLGYADEEIRAEHIDTLERFAYSDTASNPWLRGWIHTVLFMSHYRLGNISKSISACRIAMEHYTDYETMYAKFFMHLNLGMAKFVQGEIFVAYRSYRRAEKLIEQHFSSDKTLIALPHILLATVYYQLNRIQKAKMLVDSSLTQVERYEGWPELYILVYRVACDISYHTGGLNSAMSALSSAENTVNRRNLPRLHWHIVAKKVELYCLEGRLNEAAKLAGSEELLTQLKSGGNSVRFAWSEQQAVSITLARLALYNKEPKRALAILALCEADAEADRMRPFLLRKLLISMMAHMDCEDLDNALSCLNAVLSIKSGDALLRTYLDEGARLSDCLKRIVNNTKVINLPENVNTFIKNMLALGRKDAESFKSEVHKPFDILSQRELEILKELSLGGANKSIANTLNISERTIKFHLQNIYAKLGVNSRTKALNVAHRYHLI